MFSLLSVTVPITYSASTLGDRGGVFTSYDDAGFAFYVWKLGKNSTLPNSIWAGPYASAWATILAAITSTASLSAPDLRASFLSLNGQINILNPIDFSNITGVNMALSAITAQEDNSGYLNLSLGIQAYVSNTHLASGEQRNAIQMPILLTVSRLSFPSHMTGRGILCRWEIRSSAPSAVLPSSLLSLLQCLVRGWQLSRSSRRCS